LKGISDIKEYLRKNFNRDVPEGFSDRELLKFIAANAYNLQKASMKLNNHFDWLSKVSGIRMNKQVLDLV
jgi:hypothetical protein